MIENGTVIAGRYEIVGKIGTGGMSDVYRAMDNSLGRIVAVKVLKEQYVTDTAFVTRFRSEAMAAAGLEHPNIVNVYDVGEEAGRHFIVMEYIEGITLKTYIAKKGHLSTNELLSIAIQVGRGIESAHNNNIIHRDIKPQNIIISKEGKVKVTDFGIAHAVTGDTINADRMGSVHYSSPEQTKNDHVSFQSDIYSLGIVMFEMCTGRVPFDGDTTVAIAIQHLQNDITPPGRIISGVPKSVEKIILRATMKDTLRRYPNITEMLTDLKKALINPDEDFVYIPPAPASIKEPEIIEQKNPTKTEEKKPVRVVVDDYDDDDDYDEDDYDDDDDDESGVSRKMDKAVTIMGIAAGIVIILIVIYILGSFLGLFSIGRGSKSETTSSISTIESDTVVPDVLGKTEDEAKKMIEDAGFEYKLLGEASSEEYEAGLVMDQSPPKGREVPPGSTISVMISSGVGSKDIPNVVGQSQESAIRSIESAGFKCATQQEYSSNVDQGKVIRQTPSAGEKGKEGDTITIWVSRGKETSDVPNVVGQNQNEAAAAIQRAGFGVTAQAEPSEGVPAGIVIRQSVVGPAKPGTNVVIAVSAGVKTAYYKFEKSVSILNEEDSNYIVLYDPNRKKLAEWTITGNSTIRAQNIRVATGILVQYSADKGTELSSESIAFIEQ